MTQALLNPYRRIVFEYGITAIKEQAAWRVTCVDGRAEVPLEAITELNRLSPILVELEHPSPDPIVLLLPNAQSLLPKTQCRMLDIEIQMHEILPDLLDNRKLSEFLSVLYTAANGVYHCKRMAECYATIVSRFAAESSNRPAQVIFANKPEPFFEFDALISAAMRTLDALRCPIWRLYGNSGTMPSSFRRTIDACKGIPNPLSTTIEEAWSGYFANAKEYRDCIQHYVSPGAACSNAQLQRIPPGYWMMFAWLPDNPGVRSSEKFLYENRVDALSYAWSLTTRITQITKAIYDAAKIDPRYI